MSNLDKLKELEDKRQGVFGMMAGSTHPRTGKLITAEKETLRLIDLVNDYGEVLEQLKAAQAQLDALANQEAVAVVRQTTGGRHCTMFAVFPVGTLFYTRPAPAVPVKVPDYFSRLVSAARERAEKAMRKFPQPNYVLNKVAEESGEVIKAVIHYTEGRENWLSVEGELIDNLAMLIRLVKEGDQVIGFTPPTEVLSLNNVVEVSDG